MNGRRPIDPNGETQHLGYRATMEQKIELVDVAIDLGYKSVSELIRHIIDGWLLTFRATKGLKDRTK